MYRWGILGVGNIANRFIKSLEYSDDGILYAIATHNENKRNEMKERYNDLVIYDDYDKLLDDPHVDVVYLAMWHKDHYRWAKQALLKHKAVLCEKPATLSYDEMYELSEIAKREHVFFMEAMKTRFIPLVSKIKSLLEEGVIGDITRLEDRFCYDISQSQQTRYLFDKEQGGILNDVGSYTIASMLDYMKGSIKSIENDVMMNKGVDVHNKVTVYFDDGKTAYLEMAMDENKSPLMTIYGTKGKIECAPFYRPVEATVILDDISYKIHKSYIHDDFYTQILEVHQCLDQHRYESQRMSLSDSLKVQEVAERIRKTIRGEGYEV